MRHSIKVKVYYEDTDAGGVVYYANYLRYFERARTEFLLEHGISVAEYHRRGCIFVVAHADITYKQPARLGDIIEVTTEITELQNASLKIRHSVLRDDALLAEAHVRLATVNNEGKLQRIPEDFKKCVADIS